MQDRKRGKDAPKRVMGVISATSMLVGTVVGASVFIVPGQLASSIGPAVWLSYLIGAFVILFTAITFAQIGAVMPVSSAVYRLSVSTVNGTWGFLYIWVFMLSSIFLMPIMALTSAQYLGVFNPSLNSLPVAIGVIVLTGLLNIAGMRTSISIQNILVVVFVVVIAIFVTGGLMNASWQNFEPMLPDGVMPIVVGVVATYYAFAGFNNIIELSGEIKNPGRNMMRVVLLALGLIVVLYVGVAVASVALVEPSSLSGDAPISAAAATAFPSWFTGFIALAAVAASWTTLNGVMAALSRQIFALGKSGILPRSWSQVNRAGVPWIALVAVSLLGVFMTIFSDDVMRFVNLSGTYLLATAIVAAVSTLLIKRKLSERYEAAEFKLRGVWYYIWPGGVLLSSTFFMVLAIMQDPWMSLVSGVLVPIALLFYRWRASILRKRGTSVENAVAAAVSEEDETTSQSLTEQIENNKESKSRDA